MKDDGLPVGMRRACAEDHENTIATLTPTMGEPMRSFAVVVAVATLSGCFGTSVVRPTPDLLIENRDVNRYRYMLNRFVMAPPRGPAAAVFAVQPGGAQEIGAIEVTVEYSGWGTGGLRDNEEQFYSRLAPLAGEMGGTHFQVLRTRNFREFIIGMTVAVLAVESPASFSAAP